MDKLKIAFYSDSYLPAVDGVVTSMLGLKKELERRGHEVYIFASGTARTKRKYGNKKVFIVEGFDFKPYPQYKVAVFPYASVFRVMANKIDLIHAQTPAPMGLAAIVAAKFSGKPIVGSYHTLVNDKSIMENYYPNIRVFKFFANRSVKAYLRLFYNRCDATVAPTGTIERMLRRMKIKNTHVVPNGIDLSVFNDKNADGERVRKSLGVRSREKLVLYIGRKSREKRIETLLLAAHRLGRSRKDIKFIIGGTGPAYEYYRNYADRLSLGNVRFVGFVDKAELPDYYAACDAFCIPSTFETQGVVALEAMALGKPVIGADSLALRELIKNGRNGEKFDPMNPAACAGKIEKVLNNDGAYYQSAVKTAQNFSLEKVTDKMLSIYRLVASNEK